MKMKMQFNLISFFFLIVDFGILECDLIYFLAGKREFQGDWSFAEILMFEHFAEFQETFHTQNEKIVKELKFQ